MSKARETLALHKEVLVARASLQRLRVERDVLALRQGLRWPLVGVALASSPTARAGLFALLTLAGRRAPRLLGRAAVVAALAVVAVRMLRRAPAARGHGLPEHRTGPPL